MTGANLLSLGLVKQKMNRTLAMRVLEGKKIPYEVAAYPDSERDAAVIAHHLNVPAGQLFKTLVVTRSPAKPVLALVAADSQLDLKKLAQFLSEKKLKMAGHSEAEAVTGLQVGGISPLALLNRGFLIVIDNAVQKHEQVYVSAGRRGINLKVPVAGLLKVTGARCADISAPAPPPAEP
jgi:Cys-tRNA(Pro)/Cys-tRNA(Cys) deacylase